MKLEDMKKIAEERIKTPWHFKAYFPVPEEDERSGQSYHWCIEASSDEGSDLRICSHVAANYLNGRFIVMAANTWDRFVNVAEAAKATLGDGSNRIHDDELEKAIEELEKE